MITLTPTNEKSETCHYAQLANRANESARCVIIQVSFSKKL